MQVDTQMIKAIVEDAETEKSELYRLIGEGYQAMKDGRTSTIDDSWNNGQIFRLYWL